MVCVDMNTVPPGSAFKWWSQGNGRESSVSTGK